MGGISISECQMISPPVCSPGRGFFIHKVQACAWTLKRTQTRTDPHVHWSDMYSRSQWDSEETLEPMRQYSGEITASLEVGLTISGTSERTDAFHHLTLQTWRQRGNEDVNLKWRFSNFIAFIQAYIQYILGDRKGTSNSPGGYFSFFIALFVPNLISPKVT